MHVTTRGRLGAFVLMAMGAVLAFALMGSAMLASATAHEDDASANDLIHACVNPSSGTMKIVSSADDCKKNEQALSWNVKGVKGDAGPAGPQGPQGASGEKGEQGNTGATGEQGIPGATGAKGATGEQGIPGAQGDAGATGAQGIPGDTGATGPKGDTGATGANGTNGAPGAKGDKGDVGPAGPAGSASLVGSDCTRPNGDTGSVVLSVATDGAMTFVCDVPVPDVTSVTLSPNTTPVGGMFGLTVSLAFAAPHDMTIALSSDGGIFSGQQIIVPKGASSVASYLQAITSGTYTITATSGASQASANLEVTSTVHEGRSISSLVCAPVEIQVGGTSTCTVTLDASAGSEQVVPLGGGNAFLAYLPSVTVHTGSDHATFDVTGTQVGSQTVTARLDSSQYTSPTINVVAASH